MTEHALSGSDLVLAARQVSRSSFVFGVVLVTLGVFAVMAPLFAGITTAVFIGLLMVAGGAAETAFAFKAPSSSGPERDHSLQSPRRRLVAQSTVAARSSAHAP